MSPFGENNQGDDNTKESEDFTQESFDNFLSTSNISSKFGKPMTSRTAG